MAFRPTVALAAALWALAPGGAIANPTRDPGPGASSGAEPGRLRGTSPDPLVATACDPRERNWRSALEGLARRPGEAGARGLGEVVRRRLALRPAPDGESDPRLRDALGLLGSVRGSATAASAARPALASRDAGIRYAAAEALGAIGSPTVRDDLLALLDRDPEPLVAAAALGAVARLGGADEGRLRGLLVDERAQVRSVAARTLFKLRPGSLRTVPPEAAEVHALRLMAAARRSDIETIRAFVHPMRRLEVSNEERTSSFAATTLTPPMLRQEIGSVLAVASEQSDSLACGGERSDRERRCAVYDAQGYVTEMHFTTVLGHVYLIRIRHHGGYADL